MRTRTPWQRIATTTVSSYPTVAPQTKVSGSGCMPIEPEKTTNKHGRGSPRPPALRVSRQTIRTVGMMLPAVRDELRGGGLDFRPVLEVGVPVAAPLRG